MSAAVEAPAPRLPMLDRLLPGWIGIAMAAGLALGRLVPGLGEGLSAVEMDGISLPIAAGLLIMMYPVLAKVHYDRLGAVTGARRLLAGSLALNWVIGPALMFALAWLLPDLPEYRTATCPCCRDGSGWSRPRSKSHRSISWFRCWCSSESRLAAGYLTRRIGERTRGRDW